MKNLPDKIYLNFNMTPQEVAETNDKDFHEATKTWEITWSEERLSEHDPEYVSKDAFIEKALRWYCLDCECSDKCNANYKCFFRQTYKRFLEGNENAIPPKLADAINPDGSVSENYRYRHFIKRMQDSFIEKACEWIKENITNNPNANSVLVRNGCVTLGMLVEDFKNYMKGE